MNIIEKMMHGEDWDIPTTTVQIKDLRILYNALRFYADKNHIADKDGWFEDGFEARKVLEIFEGGEKWTKPTKNIAKA